MVVSFAKIEKIQFIQKRATFNQSGRWALNLSNPYEAEPALVNKFFPYFTLVSINKSQEEVRLLDSFYLAKGLKRTDIFLKILDGESRKMAYYWVRYRFECNAVTMRFVMLKPGIPYQTPIRDFTESPSLERKKRYVMKMTYWDGYGTPDHSVGYVARKKFQTKWLYDKVSPVHQT